MVDIPLKILIIRLSSIGDILLTTPFLRQIKSKYPKAEVDFIVKQEYKDLLRFNPRIDNLYTLETGSDSGVLRKIKKGLRIKAYDILFDLHNNLRSNYLRRGIGAKYIKKIHKNKLSQILLVKFKINSYRDIIPIPQRYLNVGKDFDIQDDNKGLELYWNQKINSSVDKKIEFGEGEPIICFAPGAAHYTKRWPKEHFNELCKLITNNTDFNIVLLGGKTDKDLGNYLEENNQVYNYIGKLDLLETANLMSRASALVTNDTGLMHMGTAVNIPVLALFGSTVKAFGFFPYRGQTMVLEKKDLSCRPCTHIGRDECPKKHFLCLQDINPSLVFENLHRLLDSDR
jgi:heptosyltransferase-2